MKLKVSIGDWSNDGHGIYEDKIINLPTIFTVEELNDFYKSGVEQVGFDFTEETCRRYEDNVIPNEQYKKLEELGYLPYKHKSDGGELSDTPFYSSSSEGYVVGVDVFLDVYMFFVGLGYKHFVGNNTSFKYIITSDDMDTVRIGGYGLFNN